MMTYCKHLYGYNLRFVLRTLFVVVIVVISVSHAVSGELKEFQSPSNIVEVLIKQERLGSWVIYSKIDVDNDGDLDELIAPEAFSSRGTVGWILFFYEDGEYFHADDAGGLSSRLDMLSFGPLEETDGHPAFVTYTKDSASTGVVSATWFKKISENEVVKYQKILREVDISYGSETAEADREFNRQLFNKLGPIEFAEYKRYTREEAIEAFDISLGDEGQEKVPDEKEKESADVSTDGKESDSSSPKNSDPKTLEQPKDAPETGQDEASSGKTSSSASVAVVIGVFFLVLLVIGAIINRIRKRRGKEPDQ